MVDGFSLYRYDDQTIPLDVHSYSNWLHDLWMGNDPGQPDQFTHNDGVQLLSCGGFNFHHNRFDLFPGTWASGDGTFVNGSAVTHVGATAALMVTNGAGVLAPQLDLVFEDNWIAGKLVTIVNGGAISTTETELGLYRNLFDDAVSSNTYDIILDSGSNVTAPGMPATSGPDTNNGNVNTSDGSPLYVNRW